MSDNIIGVEDSQPDGSFQLVFNGIPPEALVEKLTQTLTIGGYDIEKNSIDGRVVWKCTAPENPVESSAEVIALMGL